MAPSIGGGISSTTPHTSGVDGGDNKEKPSRIKQSSITELFHDEAVTHMSKADATAQLAFADNTKDIKPVTTTTGASKQGSSTFPNISLKFDTNNFPTNNYSGIELAMNTNSLTPDNVRALGYGNTNGFGSEIPQLTINTQNGELKVNFAPLHSPAGMVVRDLNGKPFLESMNISQAGKTGTTIDFKEAAIANWTGIAPLGLYLNEQATKQNAGAIILSRTDGAQIAYQTYTTGNAIQARLSAISGIDGPINYNRGYVYENPAMPSVATKIVDDIRDITNGTYLRQIRQRQGNSDIFDMAELDMRTGQLVRSETERSVLNGANGQLIYQRQLTPEQIAQAANQHVDEFGRNLNPQEKQDLRNQIVDALGKDRTWLIANDLPSAKRAFLDAVKDSSGRCRLFGGDESKAANYIDMYITRIRDHRARGFVTDSDDQLAAGLRKATSVFTNARTGEAAKMSDASLIRQTEDMLVSNGDPLGKVNQGQVGSCFVASLLISAMYSYSSNVLSKWASIMGTGQTEDGKAKFTAAELNKKSHRGETPWDFIMISACWKKRTGASRLLGGMGSGTYDLQAKREYAWLTDGGKLPMSASDYKKYGTQMGFTPGHARTYVAALIKGQLAKFFNNTWDGYGERQKVDKPRVELVA